MILELDCGNTLIKWRICELTTNTIVAQGSSCLVDDLIAALSTLSEVSISRARLVSVRSDEQTELVCSRLSLALGIQVSRAMPAPQLGGVVNGYIEYEQLGMDRWLAIVGAYQVKGGPMLVVDLGTAVTVDLVDAQGKHLGGYICPGISLLRHLLKSHTQRIRYTEDAGVHISELAPGCSTAQAVERGCLMMLRSFVDAQIQQAPTYLGDHFEVYATGGDAALIDDIAGVRCVPDLVFRGLAIACP